MTYFRLVPVPSTWKFLVVTDDIDWILGHSITFLFAHIYLLNLPLISVYGSLVCLINLEVCCSQAAEAQTVNRKQLDGFLQFLESILAGTIRKHAAAEVAAALVDYVLHAEGLQRAREIYSRY